VVDGHTMIEFERLSFIRNNQSKLRVDKYNNLCQTSSNMQEEGSTKGKRVVLPSTFVAGTKFMNQLYFDGMAICIYVGFPYLFLTFTCNPKWPEIRRILCNLNLTPSDRPDLISRVFRIKFDQLLTDLIKNHFLGKVIACKNYKESTNLLYINNSFYHVITFICFECRYVYY